MTAHWLDDLIPKALRDALTDWEWVEERGESEEDRDDWISRCEADTPLGWLFVRGLMEMCADDMRHRLIVANMLRSTPAFCDEPNHYHAALYVDERHPGKLFYAAHSEMPPILWVEIEATPQDIADVLAEYDPNGDVSGEDYPKTLRAYAGHAADIHIPNVYDGETEPAGPHGIERFWVFSPIVERYFWGSAYAKNPWAAHQEPMDHLMQSHLIGRYGKQARGRVCSRSRLTRHSRSCVRLEFHGRGYMAWQMEYRPSRFTASIARFNERTGMDYPTDLPTDAFGATLGFHFASAAAVREVLVDNLVDDGDWDQAYFNLKEWMATAYPDPDFEDRLDMFYESGSKRIERALINAGIEYRKPGIWKRLLPHCTTEEFVEFMNAHLADGELPFYLVDEHGEPEDFFAEVPSGA